MKRNSAKRQAEREKQDAYQRRLLIRCPSGQMNQASISSLGQKCCIIQTQTFFFAWFKPNQGVQSLSPSTCCQPPSIPPLPKFHLGDIFLPFPLAHMLSTMLSLLSLWIQCAVALWFTCLTNMDRGPKWFLKSSNGLWSACAVLGDNSLSLSLSLTPSNPYVCDSVRLSGCLFMFMSLCLCVRARTSTASVLSQTP